MCCYNREDAVNYAESWALKRNPAYYDFENIGGDCTNFVSQCIYAGAKIMNYSPNGWYYISLKKRSPSWTGVDFLCGFLLTNKRVSASGVLCGKYELLPADVIQLKRKGKWTHSLFVTKIMPPFNVYVCTHSYDSLNKPLSLYWYDDIRYIHIQNEIKYH